MNLSITNLRLSLEVAMLGHIFPNLRAICVQLEEKIITIVYYYDTDISKDELDLIECINDEVIADFGHEAEFDLRSIRINFPEKMPLIGHWAYHRYEKYDSEE